MISHSNQTYTKIKTGDSYKLNIQVLEEATREPLNLHDITDADYIFVSTNLTEAPQLILSLGNGIEVLDATSGIIEITLKAVDTESLKAGLNYHECKIRTAYINTHTVLDEKVLVEKQRISYIQ